MAGFTPAPHGSLVCTPAGSSRPQCAGSRLSYHGKSTQEARETESDQPLLPELVTGHGSRRLNQARLAVTPAITAECQPLAPGGFGRAASKGFVCHPSSAIRHPLP